MTVRWLTAFIDVPDRDFSPSVGFWTQVTNSALSPARGDHHEFATFLPPDGDAYLRVQRVGNEAAGCHLDVHVEDIGATTQQAADLGAAVARELDDVIVMRSPAGLALCVVGHKAESVRPSPVTLDGGVRSLVDQLCIDIPAVRYEQECEFWAALTGWQLGRSALAEFSYLVRPPGMPLRLLLQRLGEPTPEQRAGAHLDLACDDVEAVAGVHEALGAHVRRRYDYWITMSDPSGHIYCLTSRDPDSGTVSG